MGYWDDKINSGISGYGYGEGRSFAKAGAKEHLRRAAGFAYGSGAIKEDALNTLGVLTKNQLEAAKQSAFQRITQGAIPAFGIYGAYDAAQEGEGFGEYVSERVAPMIGGVAGMRIGSNLGAAYGKAAGLGVAGSRVPWAIGGAKGLALGAGIAYGVTNTLATAGKANNAIQRMGRQLSDNDLSRDFIQNKSTLTHRQKAIQQISKSSMNNRGQMLGNEAMIMQGNM